ncbi:MAG: hypothetical protein U0457_20295 [Candidatus Sericytochromatia bacterium]
MKQTKIKSATVKKFLAVLMTVSFTLPAVMLQMEQKAEAVGTLAGTTIGNQATAKYKDVNNNKFVSSSNLVTTKVNAIYGVEITQGPLNTDNSPTGAPVQTQNATPNTVVYYPYVIQNTGNTADKYALTANADAGNPKAITNLKVFLDNDGDGRVSVGDIEVPAGNQTPTMSPDQKLKLVVQYQVPLNAVAAEVYKVNLRTVSAGDATKVDGTAGGASGDENFNRTTITTNAVVAVTKAVDHSTANPGEDLVYSFKIDNTGNNGSTYVKFTDNVPNHVTAIVGSEAGGIGTWKYWDGLDGTGTQVVTAGPQTSVKSVTFEYGVPGAGQPVILPAANSRTVSFKVRVKATAPATTIPNNAKFGYTDQTGTNIVDPASGQNTNIVTTDINKKAAVIISPAGNNYNTGFTPFDGVQDGANNDGTETDMTTAASVPAGTYLFYKNVVRNNGNSTDAFDIEWDSANPGNVLPTGATVTFFRVSDTTTGANNNLPLLDTNNNGKIDTGNLPPYTNPDGSTNAAGEVAIVAKVFIPANTAGGSGPYTAVVKATSTNGGGPVGTTPTQKLTDTTRDRVTAVTAPALDLTNVILGATTNTAATFTESADGTTVSYPLDVANTAAAGAAPDTYNLSASLPGIPGATTLFYPVKKSTTLSVAGTAGDTTVTLPTAAVTGGNAVSVGDKLIINGQTLDVAAVNTGTGVVTFAPGQSLFANVPINSTVTDPQPAPISSSSVLNPGTSQKVVAVVTVPKGTAPTVPAGVPITFTQTSNNNGASDQIVDNLVVPQFKDFKLEANRSGSGPAGGVLFYDHIVTNTGNVADTYTINVPTNGTNGLLYQIIDSAGNPVPTANLTTPSIPIGGTYTFKVKVTIPQGTANGTVDSEIVTATNTNTVNNTRKNTDITTVVDGFLSLVKSVVTYTAASGATGGTVKDATGATADPQDILEYTITYTNIGNSNAIESVIEDIVPANTTFVAGSLKVGATGATDAFDNGDPAETLNTNTVVRFRVGTGATNTGVEATSIGGTVAQGGTGTVTFRVRVN